MAIQIGDEEKGETVSCCLNYEDKQFSRHLISHTGEMKYECFSCRLRFSHMQSYEKHVENCNNSPCIDHSGPHQKKRVFIQQIRDLYPGLLPDGVKTGYGVFVESLQDSSLHPRTKRAKWSGMSHQEKHFFSETAAALYESNVKKYRELILGVIGNVCYLVLLFETIEI